MPGEVGSVYIRVRAITDKVAPDIQKAFSSLNSSSIAKSGEAVGKIFGKGLLNSIGNSGNLLTRLGESLSEVGGQAGSARDQFYSLNKGFNLGGTAIATLIGSVSALIGGLGGLIGAAGGAVPAVMGFVGALVSLKVGLAVGKFAMEGILQSVQKAITSYAGYGKSVAAVAKMYRDLKFAQEDAALGQKRAILELEKARTNLIRTQDMPANSMARKEALLAYQEAELNLRKAKAKNKDAALEAKNPNVFSGTDPFAGLTDSQKEFAKFLVSLKPKFDELKEAAAKGFLPILRTNLMEINSKLFPTLKKGFNEIGKGLGGLTTELTKAITDPGNVKLLGDVMHNIAGDLPVIGTILGNVYSSFLIILKESHPLVTDFLNFLNTKTKSMKDWLQAKAASGEMKDFFARSEAIMKDLGTIIDNVLGGIGGVIEANFQPGSGGDIMLQWLKNVTGQWTNLDSTVTQKDALKQYFIDTAKNSTAILDSVGALVKEFLKLGQNQNIGKTFDALKEGAPAMGELGKKLIDAGPSLGKLVADITIFINKLVDTKAITNFFETIDGGVKAITKFIDIPIVKDLLTFLGRVHGTIFGIIALTRTTGFISKYVGESYGVLRDLTGGFSKFLDKFKIFDTIRLKGMYAVDAVKAAFTRLGPMILEALAPVGTAILEFFAALTPAGWIAIAVAAITAFFAWFFTQTDVGKKMWADLTAFFADAWNNTVKFFQDAWNSAMAFLKPAIDVVANIFKTGVDIIRGIIQVITAIFTIVFVGIGWVVQTAWDGIVAGFKAVSDFLKPILDGISAFFKPIFEGIGKFISGVWNSIQIGFQKFVDWIKPPLDSIFGFFKTVFNNISNFFKGIMNNLIGFAEGFVNFFIDGLNGIIGAVNKIKLDIPPLLRGAFGGAKSIGFNIAPVGKLKLPRLADGGTVMPSPGGSLVNVAEAGRPERIEPLDANGLSSRDKALINYLTKNSNGGNGIQIIVNPSAGMDERDLAEMVSRKLAFELRRGGY